MTSIAPIYLPYYVLIDCCMPTCTCTRTKLSKTSFFFGQILNPKTSLFLGRREYTVLYVTYNLRPFASSHLPLFCCNLFSGVVTNVYGKKMNSLCHVHNIIASLAWSS
jgi:hypothetical protein